VRGLTDDMAWNVAKLPRTAGAAGFVPGAGCLQGAGLPKWDSVLNSPLSFIKMSFTKTSVRRQYAPGLLHCFLPSSSFFFFPLSHCIHTEINGVSSVTISHCEISLPAKTQGEFCSWLKQGAGRGPLGVARRSWVPPSVHKRNPAALKQPSPRKICVCVFRLKAVEL